MRALSPWLVIVGIFPVLAYAAGSGVAANDVATTNQGAPVSVNVLANDAGFAYPANVTLVTPPSHGGVAINGSPGAPGTLLATYTPLTDFVGTDSFIYQVTDGVSTSSATVTVTVLADTDGDGVADIVDNCINVPNANQRDTDQDGYGNACDADFNNDGNVNFADLAIFKSAFGSTTNPNEDLNGDGFVNFADLAIFKGRFGRPPGPSGLRARAADGSMGFTVTGNTTALAGSGLVLQNSNGDTLSVPANGPFAFPVALTSGSAYSVTVQTQPSSPTQNCTVSAGSGTVGPGSLPLINVNCGSPLIAYVTNKAADNPNGSISAFSINPASGFPTAVGSAVPTGGLPQSVAVYPGRLFAYVSNEQDANISIFSIDPASGALTAVGSPVATGNWPQTVVVEPKGRFAYVPNENDNSISVFSITPGSGALTAVGTAVQTGTGPMSVAVDPTGRFAYVGNFKGNTISAYQIDQTSGALSPAGTEVPAGNNPFSVVVDPTGSFVYVPNESDNTISAYRIDPNSGALTVIGTVATGNVPHSVAVDPAGHFAYVTNFIDSTVSTYSIDYQATGALTLVGDPVHTGTGPQSVSLDPSGHFAYVANYEDYTLSTFSVDPLSGALTAIGTPVPTGNYPYAVLVTQVVPSP